MILQKCSKRTSMDVMFEGLAKIFKSLISYERFSTSSYALGQTLDLKLWNCPPFCVCVCERERERGVGGGGGN